MINLQPSISKLSPLFEFIKKQREIEKSRHLFELIVTFSLITFFLFFAIRPTLFTISTLVGDIKFKEILSTKLTTKIDQIIMAQDNFATIQEKYYLVDDALPSTQNFLQAKNQVDQVSSQNNLILDKISFAQSDKNYFSTQISTSASFTSSLGLITTLLNSRRVIDIPSLTFSQDKDSQSNNQINLILPIDIFFWQNQNEKK